MSHPWISESRARTTKLSTTCKISFIFFLLGASRRELDSIGGGNILRSLDSIGGGNILRHAPKSLDSIGGGHILRQLDSIGGGNILRGASDHHVPRYHGSLEKRSYDPMR